MLKKIISVIIRIFMNGPIINIVYSFLPLKMGLNRKPRQNRVVVSLTSFPQRFPTLHLCIKSILYQTYKPDKIVLYLDDDIKEGELPHKLLKLKKYGLSIEFRPENIKPHKKYFYAMQEYPDDIVITIDDDMIYERNLIKYLMQSYTEYPNAVSAKRVHRMMTNEEGKLKDYNDWLFEDKQLTTPSHALLATGVGGVLYPPHCLPQESFCLENIKKLCFAADDVWLKFMEIIGHVKVVYVPGKKCHPYLILGSQSVALNQSNVTQKQNDVFIKNMENYYNIKLEDFCEGDKYD